MRRRDGPSLAERVAAMHGHASPPASPSGPPALKHCWVVDEHGRLPGLLLEWRQTAAGWQGRTVRPVLEDGEWLVVEEWLPATSLHPS